MIPCPMGTYNPMNDSGHELNCLPCPARYSCPSTGQYEVTDPCQEGRQTFCISLSSFCGLCVLKINRNNWYTSKKYWYIIFTIIYHVF